jgi:hypothetical protein
MAYSHCPVADTQDDVVALERRIRARMPLLNGSPTVEEIQERMAGLEDRLDAICQKTGSGGYRDSQARAHDLNSLGNDFAKLEYYLFLGNDSLSEFYPLLDLFVGRLQRAIATARGEIAAGR